MAELPSEKVRAMSGQHLVSADHHAGEDCCSGGLSAQDGLGSLLGSAHRSGLCQMHGRPSSAPLPHLPCSPNAMWIQTSGMLPLFCCKMCSVCVCL